MAEAELDVLVLPVSGPMIALRVELEEEAFSFACEKS